MFHRLFLSLPFRAAVLAAGAMAARADYQADIGWTRLQAELGGALPTGVGVAVSHVEAPESGNYAPDTASAELAGKTFTLKSGASGVSSHANTVAGFFYGLTGSVAPGVGTVDLYNANNWLQAGLLNYGTTSAPKSETRVIENHSWIGSVDSGGTADVEILRRYDFAVQQSGFLGVSGLNNGAGSVPALLGSSYNGLSVGLTSGAHSYGTTTVDGAGRTKPEIVAPQSLTSWATPTVSSTAAMLWQVAPTNARRPTVMKAILLAGATKTQFPGWSRTTTRPLDTIYGAGQVNAYHSYQTLNAGQQSASGSVSVKMRGWDFNTTPTSGGRFYFFDVPAGNAASGFSAALVWSRTITDGVVGPLWGSPTSSLANLSLRLYAASGFTVGAQVDASLSTVDNVEHIHQPTLAPGRYALEVTGDASGVSYGLAWASVPTVSVSASTAAAAEFGAVPGVFTFTRAGDTSNALTVSFSISGTATSGGDFTALPGVVTFPVGASTAMLNVAPLADALVEGAETVTLTLAADIAYASGTASATVAIADAPFDAWRFAQFTNAELASPAISGELADADGDGLATLMEYALDLLPKSAASSGRPAPIIRPNGRLALVFTRVKPPTDVAYTVEVANQFGAWQSGAGVTSTVSVVDQGATELVTVESLLAPDSTQRQIIRLRVTRP